MESDESSSRMVIPIEELIPSRPSILIFLRFADRLANHALAEVLVPALGEDYELRIVNTASNSPEEAAYWMNVVHKSMEAVDYILVLDSNLAPTSIQAEVNHLLKLRMKSQGFVSQLLGNIDWTDPTEEDEPSESKFFGGILGPLHVELYNEAFQAPVLRISLRSKIFRKRFVKEDLNIDHPLGFVFNCYGTLKGNEEKLRKILKHHFAELASQQQEIRSVGMAEHPQFYRVAMLLRSLILAYPPIADSTTVMGYVISRDFEYLNRDIACKHLDFDELDQMMSYYYPVYGTIVSLSGYCHRRILLNPRIITAHYRKLIESAKTLEKVMIEQTGNETSILTTSSKIGFFILLLFHALTLPMRPLKLLQHL